MDDMKLMGFPIGIGIMIGVVVGAVIGGSFAIGVVCAEYSAVLSDQRLRDAIPND
jgi:hypothetical protein